MSANIFIILFFPPQGKYFITELIRPKTPASVGGGFQRAVKSSMDSANIQRGLNPPLNEVSFNLAAVRPIFLPTI
ncbi:MAG: hypothetical protein AB1815_02150 [Bacillota bacterium]